MKDMKDMKNGNLLFESRGVEIRPPRPERMLLPFFMSFMLFMSFLFRLLKSQLSTEVMRNNTNPGCRTDSTLARKHMVETGTRLA